MSPEPEHSVLSRPDVSVVRVPIAGYPPAPFSPEYRLAEYGRPDVENGPNHVYEGVRQALRSLGLDSSNWGSPAWNPLGALINPGDVVVVKPNLICEANWEHPERWEEVITHPSVIRAVVDHVLIALKGRGRVVIADGPQTFTDFACLCARSGLDELLAYYGTLGHAVGLCDLRRDRWYHEDGVVTKREALPGDSLGYTEIDLQGQSAFSDYRLNGRFYAADYDVAETRSYHSNGRHAYVLCNTVLGADVLINIPKLKTHKKTGVTLGLKNMVGANGLRNCLPHHTIGTPARGGDEFPSSGLKRNIESALVGAFKRALSAMGGVGGRLALELKRGGTRVFGDSSAVIRSGNWSGNDTAWRMVLDLNQAILWHGLDGARLPRPRRYLQIVDGVVGGEGNGPLAPDPVDSRVLIAGWNPWATDWVACGEMGIDPARIPLLSRPAAQPEKFSWLLPNGDPVVLGDLSRPPGWRPFRPHFGWNEVANPDRITAERTGSSRHPG